MISIVAGCLANHDRAHSHVREGAHIDRKNDLGNVSDSTLPNHLLQQGLGHGAHRHEDSVGSTVVMYLNTDQISRPPTPPIVSSWKGIVTCFSFMFLGVPRHYARRSCKCWGLGIRNDTM